MNRRSNGSSIAGSATVVSGAAELGGRGQPVGITRLSENLVLWRDDEATVRASRIAVRTAARGSRSGGTRRPARVLVPRRGGRRHRHVRRCGGQPCRSRASSGESYPSRSTAARSSLLRDEAHPEPCALELPRSSQAPPTADPLLCEVEMQLPLRDRQRHGPDARRVPARGCRNSMASGTRPRTCSCARPRTGLAFEKTNQRDVNSTGWSSGSRRHLAAAVQFPIARTPDRAQFRHRRFATPVDEENCLCSSGARASARAVRDLWQFMYRTKLEGCTGRCSSRTGSCSRTLRPMRARKIPLPARHGLARRAAASCRSRPRSSWRRSKRIAHGCARTRERLTASSSRDCTHAS